IRAYVVGGPDSSAMATEILALCTSKPRYRSVRCWCIMVIGPTSTYVALRRTSFVPPAQPTVTACAGPSILTSRGDPPLRDCAGRGLPWVHWELRDPVRRRSLVRATKADT